VNAKAVAYLHTLHDDPSPQHFWQDVDCESEAALSLVALVGRHTSDTMIDSLPSHDRDDHQSQKSLLFTSLRKGKFKERRIEVGTAKVVASPSQPTVVEVALPLTKVETAVFQLQTKLNVQLGSSPARSRSSPSTVGSRYAQLYDEQNGSFTWTEPFPKLDGVPNGKNHDSFLVDINECFPEFSPTHREATFDAFQYPVSFQKNSGMLSDQKLRLQRNTSISKYAVVKGYEMLRRQREYDITTGEATRIVPSSIPIVKKTRSKTQDNEPLDPIQRAGRRLLSKAAVPIQAAARRFLAQLEAVDRMWALIEIQSYVRRWRAEAALISSSTSAISIQTVVRGYLVVQRRELCNKSAVTIQKVVRGYLVAARTYDLVYRIVMVQARARGWVTRFRIRRHYAQVESAAQLKAAHKIQTWWRGQSSRMLYQFLRHDTIVTQSTIRCYLAKQHVNRLREVRAIASATKIQAIWRGFHGYTEYIFCLVDILLMQRVVRCWLAKREVQEKRDHRAATKIQTIWRCYVAFFPYKQYQAAVSIQKEWRRYVSYSVYKTYRSATTIQKTWRGYVVRLEKSRYRAAVTIQKEWRCFSTYTDYIFALADIIRIQNVVRNWLMKKEASTREMENSAVKIQATFRAHHAFDRYTTTVFRVVQIQCFVRSFFAGKLLHALRSERSTVAIQKTWRRYSARMFLLNDFVRVILIQSLARRNAAQNLTQQMRSTNEMTKTVNAATMIQTRWRGFWEYSHYVILQYEVVRIQSIIRGNLFRNDFNLQLGCSIMIQAAVRRFLAINKLRQLKVYDVWANGREYGERDVLASTRIQFWWRVVLECRKEKRAALVIERFFLMIKRDIDLEVQRREKMKEDKRRRRHRLKKEDDNTMLERAWLNALDSNSDLFSFTSGTASDVFDFSPVSTPLSFVMSPRLLSPTARTPSGSRTPRSPAPSSVKRGSVLSPAGIKKAAFKGTSTPRKSASSMSSSKKSSRNSHVETATDDTKRNDSFSHRASSPPKHLVMRHEYDVSPGAAVSKRPTSARTSRSSNVLEHSDRSAASPLRRAKALIRKKSVDLAENLSLEEAFLDAAILQGKQQKQSKNRRSDEATGSQTAPYKSSNANHFFADDLESIDDGCNFLDDVTDAAELLTDFGRAQRKRITSDLSSTLLKTRSSINEVSESLASRLPSSSSFRLGIVSSKSTNNETPKSSSVVLEPSHTPSSRTKTSRSNNAGSRTTPTSTRSAKSLLDSPSQQKNSGQHHTNLSPRHPTVLPSPRHGKILVMSPYPDYHKKLSSRESMDIDEYNGEEFGMI
jgi:IQ calmodulin-binding motif